MRSNTGSSASDTPVTLGNPDPPPTRCWTTRPTAPEVAPAGTSEVRVTTPWRHWGPGVGVRRGERRRWAERRARVHGWSAWLGAHAPLAPSRPARRPRRRPGPAACARQRLHSNRAFEFWKMAHRQHVLGGYKGREVSPRHLGGLVVRNRHEGTNRGGRRPRADAVVEGGASLHLHQRQAVCGTPDARDLRRSCFFVCGVGCASRAHPCAPDRSRLGHAAERTQVYRARST